MAAQPTETRTVHVHIEGRVQGVGFRYWTELTATQLGLDGWVRNRRDGRVEAVFAGPANAVAEMLQRCQDGPPAARVDHLRVVDEDDPPPAGFEVKPTL